MLEDKPKVLQSKRGVWMGKETYLLLLDDEQYILDALKRALKDEPYGIAATTDAGEAMDILAREKIKVVVSDQRMPDVSGVEFLRDVKEKYPRIVRILFTGYTDFSTVEDAINLSEAYRFITKPWNTNELKVIIYQAMEYFDLVAENQSLFEMTKVRNEELEILNKKLKDMYEMQKDFTSTVSHELRTPLASIKTAVDILASGTPGEMNADQKNILEKARRNATRLKNLIDDILNLSKMESGRAVFNFEKHSINAIIEEVADLQGPVAQREGLYIQKDLDATIPLLFLDRNKIIQVLDNLLNNAIKFTQEGGVVILSTNKKEQNHIVVCVRDTGTGIKEEDLQKVFEKFQQLGEPATRGEGGTGLGLSICREIIVRHGGKIWAESDYGKGSSFYFVLPIEERRGDR
jgi:signal transduction histidine kinase